MIENLLEPLVPERFITDERYRNGHIRIINALPGRKIMGVHTPEMRALAKELVAGEDCRDILRGFAREASAEYHGGIGHEKTLAHEEMVVWGMMINYMKCTLDERMEYVMEYVPYIDNWAVCDMFDGSAKWILRKLSVSPSSELAGRLAGIAGKCGKDVDRLTVKDVLWEYLCACFASGREFEVRFAVVMAMSYYLDREWLERVFSRVDEIDFSKIQSEYIPARALRQAAEPYSMHGKGIALGEPPYYVRMGVAWLLATALAKFPDDTRAYLRHCRLPDDVRRLYARKARESFRTRDVSPF